MLGREHINIQTIADHRMRQHGHPKSANLLKCLSRYSPLFVSLTIYSCLCQSKSDLLLHGSSGWRASCPLSSLFWKTTMFACKAASGFLQSETYHWCQDQGRCHYHTCVGIGSSQYGFLARTSALPPGSSLKAQQWVVLWHLHFIPHIVNAQNTFHVSNTCRITMASIATYICFSYY